MPQCSDSPLIRKLGIKAAMRILYVNPPLTFAVTLGPLPADVDVRVFDADDGCDLDFIIFFTRDEQELRAKFAAIAARLAPTGGLWIAWPKKASGVATDLSDDRVRLIGLEHGLVDNKVCSIDSTWSGQRFVIRLKDRPKNANRKTR
jgi:hypothetical protein